MRLFDLERMRALIEEEERRRLPAIAGMISPGALPASLSSRPAPTSPSGPLADLPGAVMEARRPSPLRGRAPGPRVDPLSSFYRGGGTTLDPVPPAASPSTPSRPPSWTATGGSGYGSTNWLNPTRAGLFTAAARMAELGRNSRDDSLAGVIANLVQAGSEGALAGSAYDQRAQLAAGRRDLQTAAYDEKRAEKAALDQAAEKDRLWRTLPNNDPIFDGLTPDQAEGLKALGYAEGSERLAEIKLGRDRYRPMTPEEKAAYGVPPDRPFRVDTRTGRPEGIGSGQEINVGPQVVQTEYQKQRGRNAANSIVDERETMRQSRALADRMRVITAGIRSGRFSDLGPGSEYEQQIREIASFLGYEQGDRLSRLQLFKSISNDLVNLIKPPGSGPVSDTDAERFAEVVPDMGKTAEANYLIAQGYIQAHERNMRLVEERARWLDEHGGSELGFYDSAKERGLMDIYPRANSMSEAFNIPEGYLFMTPRGHIVRRPPTSSRANAANVVPVGGYYFTPQGELERREK